MSRALGWVTLFLIGTDLFVLSPLLPEIARGYGIGPDAAGASVTVFALTYLVGGPCFGALADRRGRAPVLLGALAVFAVANLATGLAPSFALLLVARGVAGLAASGVTPSVYALVTASYPPARRATTLAVVTSGLLVALSTGAPAGSLLAGAVGWQGVFLVLAAITVPLLVATVVQTRRTVATGPPAGTPAGTPPSTIEGIRAVSVTALWALALYGVYTYLGTVLVGDVGLSARLLAVALVCFGIGALAGNLAGGPLIDRHGGRAISLASLTALAVVLAVLGVALGAAPTAAVVLPILAVFALVAYPYFSAHQARLLVAHPESGGSLLAWNNSAMYAGILTGSAVGGVVLTRLGPTVLALGAAGVALLAVLAATVCLPRERASA